MMVLGKKGKNKLFTTVSIDVKNMDLYKDLLALLFEVYEKTKDEDMKLLIEGSLAKFCKGEGDA